MNKNERSRKFNLVINKGANCYDNIESIIKNINNIKLYALIMHDKDTNEKGELKQPHYHLYLEFENARTCQSIIKQFEGAHVEIPINDTQSIKYLLHATKTAKDQGKYQYAIDNLLTNDINKIKQVLEETEYPIYLDEEIPTYIAQGVKTPFSFILKFGGKQYDRHWKRYNEVLISYLNLKDDRLRDMVEQKEIEFGIYPQEEKQPQEEKFEEVKDEDLPF